LEIADVGAIGPVHAAKLGAAGIASTADLIERASTHVARHRLSLDTGIREALLLRWANHVDLMQIEGVGQEYAGLLEAAGVSCTEELAQRDPQRLAESMADLIAARATVRHVPEAGEIGYWVAQAFRRTDRVEQ
jgi:predicted flap endonuclease-1-like 5' DNA nuclease